VWVSRFEHLRLVGKAETKQQEHPSKLAQKVNP
jgi:hypothetical protein